MVSRGLQDRGAQRMAGDLVTIDLTGAAADPTEEEEEAAAGAAGGGKKGAADEDEGMEEDADKELHAFEVDPAQACTSIVQCSGALCCIC